MEGEKLQMIIVDFYARNVRDQEKEKERIVTRGEAGLSYLELTETHPDKFKV